MSIGMGLCPFASNGKQIKECPVVVNPLCLGLVAMLCSLMIAFFGFLSPKSPCQCTKPNMCN